MHEDILGQKNWALGSMDDSFFPQVRRHGNKEQNFPSIPP